MYIDRDEYIWRSPLHLAVMKGDIALPMVRALLTMSRATDINLPSHCDSKYSLQYMYISMHLTNRHA